MNGAAANWLTPVNETLQALKAPQQLFFRDDDAGWADQKLYTLLDVFDQASAPLDLAIIPNCLTNDLIDTLQTRCASQALGIHQHGFQHANHALTGRKCEFGEDRTEHQQFNDIDKGRSQLLRAFGALLDPIFTPPWNRCSRATINCLIDLKFLALSRDRTAEALDLHTLTDVPIAVDWCRFDDRAQLGHAIAKAIDNNHGVGIMLHHAVMSTNCLRALQDLLLLLKRCAQVQCCLMRDLLDQKATERNTQ